MSFCAVTERQKTCYLYENNIVIYGTFFQNINIGELPTLMFQKALQVYLASRFDCSSYISITLLSVTGKVFVHFLLAKASASSDPQSQQSGILTQDTLLAGMDAIVALRLLNQKSIVTSIVF